ncbi:MAG TPA: hypothetical protein VFM55_03530 [Micromonosporaceae bacterium]|nr:hypothetical protein [Micromonosporaceae bacterium]
MIYVKLVLALLGGLAGGFLVRKRSASWCPCCGATMRCANCLHLHTRTV